MLMKLMNITYVETTRYNDRIMTWPFRHVIKHGWLCKNAANWEIDWAHDFGIYLLRITHVIFHEIYKCNQQNKIRINEDKNNENKENLDNVWYLSN